MATRFIWGSSDIYGMNVIMRIRDGVTSFVCDADPKTPQANWDLLRLLNDPLAREVLKLTRPDLHNLED